jgi:hypothetical protein
MNKKKLKYEIHGILWEIKQSLCNVFKTEVCLLVA